MDDYNDSPTPSRRQKKNKPTIWDLKNDTETILLGAYSQEYAFRSLLVSTVVELLARIKKLEKRKNK